MRIFFDDFRLADSTTGTLPHFTRTLQTSDFHQSKDGQGLGKEYIEQDIDIMDHQVFNNRTSGNPGGLRIVPFHLDIQGFTDNTFDFRNNRVEPLDMPDTDRYSGGGMLHQFLLLLQSGADGFLNKNMFFCSKDLFTTPAWNGVGTQTLTISNVQADHQLSDTP